MDFSEILQRLKHARVQAMLFLLLSFGLVLHAAVAIYEQRRSAAGIKSETSEFGEGTSATSSVSLELAKSIADACIVSFLLGLTYEWKVRKETETHLSLLIDEKLKTHDAVVSAEIASSAASLGSRIDSALTDTFQATPIHSEIEFFDRLEASIMTATQRVDLTYFDKFPPATARTPRASVYYQHLAEIMQARRHINFRRLIRANEAMWPRLEELIKSESGHPNASVGCLIDLHPDRECSEAVTVQLIDDETVFFVSVGTQTNTAGPRDMVITSKQFAAMWSRYYDQLWRDSVVIVERGSFKELEWRKVKQLTTVRKPNKGIRRQDESQKSESVTPKPAEDLGL